MGNLLTSTIGRKLIMSVSGLFLVLFLLFHMSMNLAAVFSTEAYNASFWVPTGTRSPAR